MAVSTTIFGTLVLTAGVVVGAATVAHAGRWPGRIAVKLTLWLLLVGVATLSGGIYGLARHRKLKRMKEEAEEFLSARQGPG
jgi:hypothetical protein